MLLRTKACDVLFNVGFMTQSIFNLSAFSSCHVKRTGRVLFGKRPQTQHVAVWRPCLLTQVFLLELIGCPVRLKLGGDSLAFV